MIMDFDKLRETREKMVKGMAEIERAITELDLAIMEAWEALDMMSFIGQDIPMKIYIDNHEVEDAKITYELSPTIAPRKRPVLNVRINGQWTPLEDGETGEVPLVRHEGESRIEIGTAKVHSDGRIDAIVNHEGAGFLPLPDPSEYSFFTDLPSEPKWKWWASRVSLKGISSQMLEENEKLLREEIFNPKNQIKKTEEQ